MNPEYLELILKTLVVGGFLTLAGIQIVTGSGSWGWALGCAFVIAIYLKGKDNG